MVDRDARNQMAQAIRSYMSEEITAFQFDDMLGEIEATSGDETVHFVRKQLWFFYDDCKDHPIAASKEEWDYFNRHLLLLESARELRMASPRWRWGSTNVIAAICFVLCLPGLIPSIAGGFFYIYALPFGPVSMALFWFNSRRERKTTSLMETALTPFPSVRSLLDARREVSGFTKIKYPGSLAGRRIRSSVDEILMWIPLSIIWCMLAPMALFFQMLPKRDEEIEIRFPEPEGVNGAG